MKYALGRSSTHPWPRRSAGFTVIELLVYGLISVVVGAGLWNLLAGAYNSQYEIMNQNNATTNTRQVLDTLIDKLRAATKLTAATGSDVTYTDSNGNSIRYWLSGTKVLTTTNGLPVGGTTAFSYVTALTFLYFTWNGASWSSSSAPATPSTVGAVNLTVQSAMNGSSRQILGTVVIRDVGP